MAKENFLNRVSSQARDLRARITEAPVFVNLDKVLVDDYGRRQRWWERERRDFINTLQRKVHEQTFSRAEQQLAMWEYMTPLRIPFTGWGIRRFWRNPEDAPPLPWSRPLGTFEPYRSHHM